MAFVRAALEVENAYDDRLLLKRVASGDREAFWQLWIRHRPHLERHCLHRYFDRPEDAEDALSEAMIEAWRSLPRSVGRIEDVKAWLTGLTRHVCEDLRQRQGQIQWEPEPDVESVDGLVEARGEDPQNVLLQQELQLHLLGLIQRLPRVLRETLILYTFQEMSYADIAQKLGISAATARKRVQIARDALRKGLRAYSKGSEGPHWNRLLPLSSLETAVGVRLAEIELQSGQLAHRPASETLCQVVEAGVATVTLPDGVEMNYPVYLDQHLDPRPEAIPALRSYLQQHPAGWKKRLELAHRLYVRGEWDAAILEYRQVLDKQPALIQGRLVLWYALHLMGKDTEAAEICQAGLQQDHRPANQRLLRALMHLTRRCHEEAARELERAVALEPNRLTHRHVLAWVRASQGQHLEVIRVCEGILAQAADDPLALLLSVEALQAQGRWQEVCRRLERVVERDPDHALALARLAFRRCAQRWVEGEPGAVTWQALQRALALAPDLAEAYSALAHWHMSRGEWQQGTDAMRQFVRQHPHAPQGWHYWAYWLLRAGRYQDAAQAAVKAREAYPLGGAEAFEVYRLACWALAWSGCEQDLREALDDLLHTFGSRWEAWTTAGLIQARWLDEPERACGVALRALELQPQLAAPWLEYGEILGLAGRHAEALTALQAGWSRLPADGGEERAAGAAWRMGRNHRALGQEGPAREWFQRAVERGRQTDVFDPAYGSYWAARALEALGEAAQAANAYQVALDSSLFYPERYRAEQALRRLTRRSA